MRNILDNLQGGIIYRDIPDCLSRSKRHRAVYICLQFIRNVGLDFVHLFWGPCQFVSKGSGRIMFSIPGDIIYIYIYIYGKVRLRFIRSYNFAKKDKS